MKRYENIKIIKNRNKSHISSVRFPKIYPKNSDTILLVTSSMRLDILAHDFYNDQSLWWIIALANNLSKGSLELTPGTQIRIPSDYQRLVKEYNNINK